MGKVHLSLALRESHLSRVSEVVRAAKRVGMTVEQRLSDIGVLTGSIDADKLDQLRRVPGVADVEAERSVGIAPPRSDVQ